MTSLIFTLGGMLRLLGEWFGFGDYSWLLSFLALFTICRSGSRDCAMCWPKA